MRMLLFSLFCSTGLQRECNRGTLVIQVLVQHAAGMAVFSFIRLILRQDQGGETVKILQFLIKKLCKYMNSHMMNKVTRHESIYVYTI